MNTKDVPKSFPKIDEKARNSTVSRQAYFLVELNTLIRKRIKEDRMTTVDVLGVMKLASAKLAIDSLRPEQNSNKEEEMPSYFG